MRKSLRASARYKPGEGDLRALPLSNDERARIAERLKYEGLS
jgi:hypothetical protein